MSPPNSSLARAPSAPGPNATLQAWLTYLEALHPSEIDLGLDRVLIVFRRLFRSNPAARIITVGGTNGKGSTVAALEKLLASTGRATGAYTSPHLKHYNERVRINGVDASDETLVRAFEAVEAARQSTSLTYFEFGTLAAFIVLQEAGVDDWILEVGLGGRLDAVNVLDADLAIITSVDLDHVAYLGSDRETIGFEKAGILRPGIPAIFADVDPPESVLQQVSAQRVRLFRPGAGYTLEPISEEPGVLQLRIGENSDVVRLPSTGLPEQSLAAAIVAMTILQPEISRDQLAKVVSSLSLPGRFEQLLDSPRVIADVGHNPHAARWLAARIAVEKSSYEQVYAVYGALADKDVEGVVEAVAPQVDRWFFSALGVPRGLSCGALSERLPRNRVGEANGCYPSVSDALSAALELAGEKDLILVFGSFYTVAEARDVMA